MAEISLTAAERMERATGYAAELSYPMGAPRRVTLDDWTKEDDATDLLLAMKARLSELGHDTAGSLLLEKLEASERNAHPLRTAAQDWLDHVGHPAPVERFEWDDEDDWKQEKW